MDKPGIYLAKNIHSNLEYLVSVIGHAPLMKLVYVISLEELQNPDNDIKDIIKEESKHDIENNPDNYIWTFFKDIIQPPEEEKIIKDNNINLPKKLVNEVISLLMNGKKIEAIQLLMQKKRISLEQANEKIKQIQETL